MSRPVLSLSTDTSQRDSVCCLRWPRARGEELGRLQKTGRGQSTPRFTHLYFVDIYPIVSVQLRYTPARAIPVDTLSNPFFSRIIQIPAIEFLLRRRRPICEGVKLIDPSHLAGPALDGFINITRLVLGGEVEADKSEISTTDAN